MGWRFWEMVADDVGKYLDRIGGRGRFRLSITIFVIWTLLLILLGFYTQQGALCAIAWAISLVIYLPLLLLTSFKD